jgi:hypothetical protein
MGDKVHSGSKSVQRVRKLSYDPKYFQASVIKGRNGKNKKIKVVKLGNKKSTGGDKKKQKFKFPGK